MNAATLEFVGEPVTVSYLADPTIGHGRFRLENHGVADVVVVVESAWLEIEGRRSQLEGFSVFDLEQDRMLNPTGIRVESQSVISFLLGFPKVAYEPRLGEASTVLLQISVEGAELQAFSMINFVRRIPRSP